MVRPFVFRSPCYGLRRACWVLRTVYDRFTYKYYGWPILIDIPVAPSSPPCRFANDPPFAALPLAITAAAPIGPRAALVRTPHRSARLCASRDLCRVHRFPTPSTLPTRGVPLFEKRRRRRRHNSIPAISPLAGRTLWRIDGPMTCTIT